MKRPFRPYAERSIHELIYLAAVLRQQDKAIPTDLEAALDAQGVDLASV